ncbi:MULTISPECIES: LysR family transcriptional regulator [unclassified Sphingobium]|nr:MULTISPECIES: LysR family transcriptional regulator [unclassified Sphingobium]CAH0355387.1 HTH-type transcriptional regulator BenM [Sphingobium sp. CECT 9361]
MSFSICQIRHVLAAADHGSFYKAARALGMEQSTLSRDVAKLERMIGVQIFVRSRAGISTTGAGRDFIRCVRPMLANADKLVAIMRAAGQGRAGDLVIGHYCSLSAGNLRATMLGWRGAHPDVNLDGIEANRGALLAGLDTGEIDIAIMAGEAAHDGYQREAFWSERVMVALSSSHPLAEREIIHWTDLRSERFLLPATDPGPEIRDMLLGRLSVAGMQPDVRMHQSGHGTILSVLGDGRGLSIICEGGSGTQYPNVVYRPMYGEQGPVLICYSGYWRDENCNPALRRFLQFVKTRYALSFKISENSVE